MIIIYEKNLIIVFLQKNHIFYLTRFIKNLRQSIIKKILYMYI